MRKFNTLEPIIRDMKKLVNHLLTPHSPLDRIIIVCNRLLALKGSADLNKALEELRAAFSNVRECVNTLEEFVDRLTKK